MFFSKRVIKHESFSFRMNSSGSVFFPYARFSAGRNTFPYYSAVGGHLQAAEMRVGNNYRLDSADVDRHQLSTSDGHVTIITVVTRKDEPKAQSVRRPRPAKPISATQNFGSSRW